MKDEEKKKKHKKMRDYIVIIILTICMLNNILFCAFKNSEAYAAAVVAGGYVAGETILSLLISGLAVAGVVHEITDEDELPTPSEALEGDITVLEMLRDAGCFSDEMVLTLVNCGLATAGIDGTSALQDYMDSLEGSPELTVYTNPNKQPDDNGSISSSIAVSLGVIASIGDVITDALENFKAQKDAEFYANGVPFSSIPQSFNTVYNGYYLDRYCITCKDGVWRCCIWNKGAILYSNDALWIGPSSYSNTTKSKQTGSGVRLFYYWDFLSSSWVYDFEDNSKYYFDCVYGDSANDLQYLKYINCRIYNQPMTTVLSEPIPFEGAPEAPSLNSYLAEYGLQYSPNVRDAAQALDENGKILIHDNPEVIEEFMNIPLSNPRPEVDPDADPGINPESNPYADILNNAVLDVNAEGKTDLSEDDRDDFENDSPESRMPDYLVDGLEDVFPFCIPFDLARCIGLLLADAEAPYIEYPFVMERWGINCVIVLDMGKFENVAKISRWIETVGFAWIITSKTKAWIFS